MGYTMQHRVVWAQTCLATVQQPVYIEFSCDSDCPGTAPGPFLPFVHKDRRCGTARRTSHSLRWWNPTAVELTACGQCDHSPVLGTGTAGSPMLSFVEPTAGVKFEPKAVLSWTLCLMDAATAKPSANLTENGPSSALVNAPQCCNLHQCQRGAESGLCKVARTYGLALAECHSSTGKSSPLLHLQPDAM